jgi:hypothetical protein
MKFFIFLNLIIFAYCYPTGGSAIGCYVGAPTTLCSDMCGSTGPGTGNAVITQSSTSILVNQAITVTLSAQNSFGGFFVWAIQGLNKVGVFSNVPSNAQTVTNCVNQNNGVTHIDSNGKNSLNFQWTPTGASGGNVTFNAIIVVSGGGSPGCTWYTLSNVAPVTVLVPPPAIVCSFINATNNSIIISCPILTGSLPITYNVSRNGTVVFTNVDASVTQMLTDTSLTSNTVYSYSIVTQNSNGVGPASNSLSSTLMNGPPSTLVRLPSSGTDFSIVFSWSVPDVNQNSRFIVSRNSVALQTDNTALTSQQFTDFSLNPATDYMYSVVGFNTFAIQSKTASSPTFVFTSGPSAPGVASLVNSTNTTLSFTWTAPLSVGNNTQVTAYNVSRNGTLVASVNSSTLSYVDNGLTPGTSYAYTVQSLVVDTNNIHFNGLASSAAVFSTTGVAPPHSASKSAHSSRHNSSAMSKPSFIITAMTVLLVASLALL